VVINYNISGSHGSKYEYGRVFWGVAPCSVVELGGRFRGAYCFYHNDDD
jgi:hypothetical protein